MEVIPWTSELLADGVGRTTPVEDVTLAEHLDTTRGIAPIPKRAKAKAERKATPQDSAPKEKVTKAKEKVTKAKEKADGVGERGCGQ